MLEEEVPRQTKNKNIMANLLVIFIKLLNEVNILQNV